ncbi:MAG: toxin-antitoxin system, antitoxin component, Xre family protein [bacterium]
MKQDIKITSQHEQSLVEKIRSLSPERIAEVEDFIDFLCQRDLDHRLTQSAARLSEPAFQKVWDNPDDADYDQL